MRLGITSPPDTDGGLGLFIARMLAKENEGLFNGEVG